MKLLLKYIPLFSIIPLFFACSNENKGAKDMLANARKQYDAKEYTLAQQQLDSIHILFPEAVDERKAAIALLDSLRKDENTQIIAHCDSLITLYEFEADNKKKLFSYQRNEKYQDAGAYIPKESVTSFVNSTNLRSGVEENGKIYLESVYIGGQKHTKITVTTKDGSSAQSREVTDDGFNYQFESMGTSREVIKFDYLNENGVAKFIADNKDKPLTLTLGGKATSSYILNQSMKNAIAKSVALSDLMMAIDSLKTKKEEAEFKNYYLENEKKLTK